MAHALRYLILLGALAGLARAQAPVSAVRFTVFAARPIADLSFVAREGAAPQKTTFYPTARSPRYEFRGRTPIRFADATGRVVAEATVPPGITDALFLFAPVEPAPAGGLRFQVSVLDDSALRHGPGGLAIINLSGLALSGSVGSQAVSLKPGLNPTLAIGSSAKVTFRASFKNRTYQSYADTVELGRNQRALLILFPPYYKGSLEAQSRLLLDEPPPRPASPGKNR
jgi:hypothetical protein